MTNVPRRVGRRPRFSDSLQGRERDAGFPAGQDTGESPEPRSTFPPRYQLFLMTELVKNRVFVCGNNEIPNLASQHSPDVSTQTRERKAILE